MRRRRIAGWFLLALLIASNVVRRRTCITWTLHQRGSATIIRQHTREGIKTIVVDTGEGSKTASVGGRAVLEQLQRLGVDHIDLAG